MNFYLYAYAQPGSHTDPTGLRVQVCCRPADIAGGMVDHCWLKTDTKTAGMNESPQCSRAGNDASGYPFTKVYVSDHSCDAATRCDDHPLADEECVNKELEIGKELGRFAPWNNCQTFAYGVLIKCSKKNRK
ncbi:MAG: hypothetical protein F9K47_02735 [Burkholderiales bacterium]|nr:MAG: hypothetical protein F9K47_02735 [Burkholderiales bacterium]